IKAGSESVKFNPKNNMRLYTMANYFISNNMLPEAIITVNHFLQNLTDEQRDNEFLYKVYAFMGRMYFLQEKRDAMTYLRLGAQDTSTDGEIARALFDYLTRNNESSREGIREIMKKDNSYISTHFAMAQIFEKEGKVSEAYDYYIATALMLYNSGMNDTAKRALLKGLRIKPEVPKLHEMLASIYEREEKYSTAIYHYKKADPSGSDIQNLLHITYLYYTIEDYENARKTLQKARQREDGSGRIFFTSGVIESGQKRYFEAIQYYNKAIETDDSNPSYYFYRAIVQDKAGHVEDATASLEKAVELDGENSEYLNYLGYTYAERGIKLDKALKLISDAVKQKPFNGAYLDSMGWVYYKQGQYKKAERFLTRAYRNLEAENTHDPVVYDHLGDTYRKMKQSRRAVHYWELALKHGADDKQSIRSKISQTLGENR
ncbi:MAG: tetratricopeptide repeat protein, partial [Spirochaetota bacterium]